MLSDVAVCPQLLVVIESQEMPPQWKGLFHPQVESNHNFNFSTAKSGAADHTIQQSVPFLFHLWLKRFAFKSLTVILVGFFTFGQTNLFIFSFFSEWSCCWKQKAKLSFVPAAHVLALKHSHTFIHQNGNGKVNRFTVHATTCGFAEPLEKVCFYAEGQACRNIQLNFCIILIFFDIVLCVVVVIFVNVLLQISIIQ